MSFYIVNIEKINWFGEKEAEVLFEINKKMFWAFSHPCYFTEGECTEVYFDFIEEEIPEDSYWRENMEQKKEVLPSNQDKCRYYCYGQLERIHPVIINCGPFKLTFGDWINDENLIGNYIYFVINRLEIKPAPTLAKL